MPGPRRTAAPLLLALLALLASVALTSPGGAVPAEREAPRARPAVTSVLPATGPVGTRVVIRGRHLRGVTRVMFGEAPATRLKIRSNRELTVRAPAHSAGRVVVRLVSERGRSARATASRFTFVGTGGGPPAGPPDGTIPAITEVSPSFGTVHGGAEVTLTGERLDGATSVLFGSVPVSFRQVSATSIVAVTPPHPAGMVDVQVFTSRGMSTPTWQSKYRYADCQLPEFDRRPHQVLETGGAEIVVASPPFYNVNRVLFGDVPRPRVRRIGWDLWVTVPPHPVGRVALTVLNDCGRATEPNAIRFIAPRAVITGLSPTAGPLSGGTVVTVSGRNFSDVTRVTLWEGLPVTAWTVVSRERLLVTMPRGGPGLRELVIETAAGESTVERGSANDFTFVPPPRVGNVYPGYAGVEGGARVTLTGDWFTALGGVSAVEFGGVPATDLVVVSDSRLRVTVPPHASGGVDVRAFSAAGGSVVGPDSWFSYEAPQNGVGRVVDPPLPADGTPGSAQLTSLACPAPGVCLALGSYRAPSGRAPLAVQEGGGTWSAVPFTLPADADPDRTSVVLEPLACPRPDFCATVGSYLTVDGASRALGATWDGTGWTVASVDGPVHDPAWDETQPYLDCTEEGDCVSVGYHGNGTLILVDGVWSGGSIAATRQSPTVEDVDCSETECVIVGAEGIVDEETRPLVQRWRDGAWVVQDPGLPADALPSREGLLEAVSCPGDGACVVAGSYLSSVRVTAYAATLDRGSWTVTSVPTPPGGTATDGPSVRALDCVTTSRCVATGSYLYYFRSEWYDPSYHAMVLTLARGSWHATDPDLPGVDPYETEGHLGAVTCAAPVACLAVGTYDMADSRTRGVVVPVRNGVVGPGTQIAVPTTSPEQDTRDTWVGVSAVAAHGPSTAVALGAYLDEQERTVSVIITELPLN